MCPRRWSRPSRSSKRPTCATATIPTSSPNSAPCRPTTPAGRRRCSTPAACLRPWAAAPTSSVRTWPTPARTRSTTRSARSCSRCAWARSASSPRPAPGSTESPRRRWPRSSASSATSTWAKRTSAARSSTCSACGCSGAEVLPVTSGSGTLKDATNEAIRDWVANVETTHYIIGSVVGPAPYPTMVRDFQSVIGNETRAADPRQGGQAARRHRGLRRRGQQRHRHVPSLRG